MKLDFNKLMALVLLLSVGVFLFAVATTDDYGLFNQKGLKRVQLEVEYTTTKASSSIDDISSLSDEQLDARIEEYKAREDEWYEDDEKYYWAMLQTRLARDIEATARFFESGQYNKQDPDKGPVVGDGLVKDDEEDNKPPDPWPTEDVLAGLINKIIRENLVDSLVLSPIPDLEENVLVGELVLPKPWTNDLNNIKEFFEGVATDVSAALKNVLGDVTPFLGNGFGGFEVPLGSGTFKIFGGKADSVINEFFPGSQGTGNPKALGGGIKWETDF